MKNKLYLLLAIIYLSNLLVTTVFAAPKKLNVAVIQMGTNDANWLENQENIRVLVDEVYNRWLERNSDNHPLNLILLPEFAAVGYDVSPPGNLEKAIALWDKSEPYDYPCDNQDNLKHTIENLKFLSATYKIMIGTSFLEINDNGTPETSDDNFYNIFALTNTNGEIAGTVRKSISAVNEASYIKGASHDDSNWTSNVFDFNDPNLGQFHIAVGICYENYQCDFANYIDWYQKNEHDIDLLLMPHSAPREGVNGKHISSLYVEKFNFPAIMVNKTNYPEIFQGFYGGSALSHLAGDGQIKTLNFETPGRKCSGESQYLSGAEFLCETINLTKDLNYKNNKYISYNPPIDCPLHNPDPTPDKEHWYWIEAAETFIPDTYCEYTTTVLKLEECFEGIEAFGKNWYQENIKENPSIRLDNYCTRIN